jgi:hypothetical protein
MSNPPTDRHPPVGRQPTRDEQRAIDEYKKYCESTNKPFRSEILYAFPVWGVVFTGVLYLENPPENSSTKGVVTGLTVPVGYTLDRNGALLDVPTSPLSIIHVAFDWPNRRVGCYLEWWEGQWKTSDWVFPVTW